MIVATAGHIDHGKTVLVKALTGVETDRLPEEKRRGISIDLGYAYHELPDGGILGFIDVPGHERFVRNMLAGVTGIDFGLLIVAADDGIMPQTIEHLSILDLLGIRRGAVAITKIDRVPAERVAEVIEDVRLFIDETSLAGAPVFPVSSITGDGVAELRGHIEAEAQRHRSEAAQGNFRLAIDRSFIVPGAGLVVTGTVFAGRVRINDRLVLSPGGLRVRVRGIHAQNRKSETGEAGQRCALNLTGAGLDKEHVHRGDWILDEAIHAPTMRIDARIRVLDSESGPLKHWTPIHFHLGASDVSGRVAILGARQIGAGEDHLVQLHLNEPVGALTGDRLILRDQSAQRTIAGGSVIDPFPPRRGRARPERLANLAAMESPDPAEALTGLLDISPGGIDLGRFARSRNLSADEAGALWQRVAMHRFTDANGETGISLERWQSLGAAVLDALKRWHDDKPDQPGANEPALRQTLDTPVPAPLFRAAIGALVAAGKIMNRNMVLRLPRHIPAMAKRDAELWGRIRPVLEGEPLQPPSVHDMARDIGLDPDIASRFLNRASGMGLVIRVADNRYLLPEAVLELGEIAETVAARAADGQVTAATFRDEAGIGRNLSIQILEYFDRAGLTKRSGDTRQIVRPATEVFGGPAA